MACEEVDAAVVHDGGRVCGVEGLDDGVVCFDERGGEECAKED